MHTASVFRNFLGAAVTALVVTVAGTGAAQAPFPPGYPAGEAGDIAACLCLGQAVNALSAEMASEQGDYHAAQDELARIDSELQRARAMLDVQNPAALAQFRELAARRDAAFRRSTSIASGGLSTVVQRYNARVTEYNARCANHPRDPILLQSVQANLVCPPAY